MTRCVPLLHPQDSAQVLQHTVIYRVVLAAFSGGLEALSADFIFNLDDVETREKWSALQAALSQVKRIGADRLGKGLRTFILWSLKLMSDARHAQGDSEHFQCELNGEELNSILKADQLREFLLQCDLSSRLHNQWWTRENLRTLWKWFVSSFPKALADTYQISLTNHLDQDSFEKSFLPHALTFSVSSEFVGDDETGYTSRGPQKLTQLLDSHDSLVPLLDSQLSGCELTSPLRSSGGAVDSKSFLEQDNKEEAPDLSPYVSSTLANLIKQTLNDNMSPNPLVTNPAYIDDMASSIINFLEDNGTNDSKMIEESTAHQRGHALFRLLISHFIKGLIFNRAEHPEWTHTLTAKNWTGNHLKALRSVSWSTKYEGCVAYTKPHLLRHLFQAWNGWINSSDTATQMKLREILSNRFDNLITEGYLSKHRKSFRSDQLKRCFRNDIIIRNLYVLSMIGGLLADDEGPLDALQPSRVKWNEKATVELFDMVLALLPKKPVEWQLNPKQKETLTHLLFTIPTVSDTEGAASKSKDLDKVLESYPTNEFMTALRDPGGGEVDNFAINPANKIYSTAVSILRILCELSVSRELLGSYKRRLAGLPIRIVRPVPEAETPETEIPVSDSYTKGEVLRHFLDHALQSLEKVSWGKEKFIQWRDSHKLRNLFLVSINPEAHVSEDDRHLPASKPTLKKVMQVFWENSSRFRQIFLEAMIGGVMLRGSGNVICVPSKNVKWSEERVCYWIKIMDSFTDNPFTWKLTLDQMRMLMRWIYGTDDHEDELHMAPSAPSSAVVTTPLDPGIKIGRTQIALDEYLPQSVVMVNASQDNLKHSDVSCSAQRTAFMPPTSASGSSRGSQLIDQVVKDQPATASPATESAIASTGSRVIKEMPSNGSIHKAIGPMSGDGASRIKRPTSPDLANLKWSKRPRHDSTLAEGSVKTFYHNDAMDESLIGVSTKLLGSERDRAFIPVVSDGSLPELSGSEVEALLSSLGDSSQSGEDVTTTMPSLTPSAPRQTLLSHDLDDAALLEISRSGQFIDPLTDEWLVSMIRGPPQPAPQQIAEITTNRPVASTPLGNHLTTYSLPHVADDHQVLNAYQPHESEQSQNVLAQCQSRWFRQAFADTGDSVGPAFNG